MTPNTSTSLLRATTLALLLAGAPVDSRAASLTLPAMKDNTIYSETDVSNGSGSHLFAGRSALAQRKRRALLAFDVAGNVPAGSTITAASLQLHMSRTIVGERTVSLHRLLQDWGEGPSIGAGSEGGGILAQPGDATWRHTLFNTSFWSTPGGDFDPEPSGSTTVGLNPTFYTWGSALLIEDAQGWLDDPSSNFGWILIGDESQSPTAKRFDSRSHDVEALRPKLFLAFTPPASPLCGNGVVDPPEFCDDGNTQDGDACPADCMPPTVPAASAWSLLIMLLLIASAGTVLLRCGPLASPSPNASNTAVSRLPPPVFDAGLYARVLGGMLALTLAGLLAASRMAGPLDPADPFGALCAASALAYWVHLWLMPRDG